MRRVLMLICCIGILIGCADKQKMDDSQKEREVTEESAAVEVNKGLLHVELTIPSDFFEEEELEQMKTKFKEEYHAKIKPNDDGSWTMKMSKKEHKLLLKEMKEDISSSVNEIIDDEEYGSIKNITYNEKFTVFKMIVDEEAFLNSLDGFTTLALGISGTYYQVFSGKDIEKEKVMIKLINVNTKEVFDEILYPDVMNEMEETDIK